MEVRKEMGKEMNDDLFIERKPTFEWTFNDWNYTWRSYGKIPNKFHRIMMRLLCGWKFRRL